MKVARAIADSPLVKTCMNGQDPNWGRVISSAGAALTGRSLPKSALHLCGVVTVEGGAASPVSDADQEKLHAGMKDPEIDIDLELGLGAASAAWVGPSGGRRGRPSRRTSSCRCRTAW